MGKRGKNIPSPALVVLNPGYALDEVWVSFENVDALASLQTYYASIFEAGVWAAY